MTSLTLCLLLSLGIWTTVTSAFTFTNSFAGWVGNTTYTITWSSSKSDPDYYDLVLARPHNISDSGVEISGTWPMDWAINVATQIPSFGDQLWTFTLPPDCQPGYYYWVLQTDKNIPVSSTFFIASSPEAISSAAPSSTQATVTSFIPVTATQSVIGTSNGQLVTFKPSDVFSSAVVYTTVVVVAQGGKGMPPAKIHMIVGVTLAALFMITMPIVVWLVLRYRRRPTELSNSTKGSDKRPPPLDAENLANSSTLDLLAPGTARSESVVNGSAVSTQSTRQVWTIVDGEKRQVTVPQYPPPPAPLVENRDPFADPASPARHRSLPRIAIPHNVSESNNSAPSSSTPTNTLLSHGNTITSRTAPSAMYLHNEPSAETQTESLSSTALLGEKASRPRRPRPTQETQPLSPGELAARMFVPGRAVDMGPLGRNRFGDVDENGLLPPDYSQATQPIRPPQAGPGSR